MTPISTRVGYILSLVALAGAFLHAFGQPRLISGKHPTRKMESAGPEVAEVKIPPFPGAHAVWGATGQDARGHIWFGVAAAATKEPSAHLFEYDPDADRTIDRGNVVDQLRAAGLWRDGEHQAKIHSRIVQGPDDYLYFASMDEEGENEDGSQPPTWGGHLWRLKLTTNRWEHLLAAPQALIATAAGDRFVYALGYFGHVLYQFDTRSQSFKHIEVGSLDGHVSRNFFADYRGHVFVPRLRSETTRLGRRVVRASLVEFDSGLREIRDTPLDHYLFNDSPTASHGITGLQEMSDRSWYFTTHVGFLYHAVVPMPPPASAFDESAAAVVAVAWMHPDGPTYIASLFTTDGTNTLVGLSHDSLAEGASGRFQWLTYDLAETVCHVAPFAIPGRDRSALDYGSLYASATRDAHGQHYLAGIVSIGNGDSGPIVLRVRPRAAR